MVLPGLSVTEAANIQIGHNQVLNNNRPNPVTDPEDILSQLPGGLGLLIAGADHVTITENQVVGNDSAGIAVVQLSPALAALDPRIEPLPNFVSVTGNVVLVNGRNPDPKIAPFPPSDLIWDFSGTGNCWSDNTFATAFPSPLPDCQ